MNSDLDGASNFQGSMEWMFRKLKWIALNMRVIMWRVWAMSMSVLKTSTKPICTLQIWKLNSKAFTEIMFCFCNCRRHFLFIIIVIILQLLVLLKEKRTKYSRIKFIWLVVVCLSFQNTKIKVNIKLVYTICLRETKLRMDFNKLFDLPMKRRIDYLHFVLNSFLISKMYEIDGSRWIFVLPSFPSTWMHNKMFKNDFVFPTTIHRADIITIYSDFIVFALKRIGWSCVVVTFVLKKTQMRFAHLFPTDFVFCGKFILRSSSSPSSSFKMWNFSFSISFEWRWWCHRHGLSNTSNQHGHEITSGRW